MVQHYWASINQKVIAIELKGRSLLRVLHRRMSPFSSNAGEIVGSLEALRTVLGFGLSLVDLT
ncbi:hypothetical protein [Brasilonema sp. UFV-L1]|uniref:hypothetical protein n=1 Tax=Brasilonema sp. UFV-L1 TaxID=2234130 RepID=UPI00145EA26C|nr:hypothetical protein [Brasilonema sp. UFV-L1]NMG11189.1 hypothetical protein [Brasilonema sp. UFV-L1]